MFFTVYEDQEEVNIKVYQGEDPDALENVEIGTFLFSGLNRRRGAYEQGLLFTCSLDLDGLLQVHARERATGREIRGVVENTLGRSTDEELGAARERVSALWGEAGDAAAGVAGDLRARLTDVDVRVLAIRLVPAPTGRAGVRRQRRRRNRRQRAPVANADSHQMSPLRDRSMRVWSVATSNTLPSGMRTVTVSCLTTSS